MEAVAILAVLALLAWVAASPGVAWWLPAVPLAGSGIVALIEVVGHDSVTVAVGEEPPILEGVEVVLWVALTLWLLAAVCLGWAIRLARAGKPWLASPVAFAGIAPLAAVWVWL